MTMKRGKIYLQEKYSQNNHLHFSPPKVTQSKQQTTASDEEVKQWNNTHKVARNNGEVKKWRMDMYDNQNTYPGVTFLVICAYV